MPTVGDRSIPAKQCGYQPRPKNQDYADAWDTLLRFFLDPRAQRVRSQT